MSKVKGQRQAEKAIDAYIEAQAQQDLLRFITCGSVDDGKSTLIGRLLYEAKCLFEDQVSALQNESKRYGTQEGNLDFALLVDGLSAEREQGITIDVAYRFFKTQKRSFIVADTPGHEQYTRNMVTGASTADAAVLLIDARYGVLAQTKRHAYITSLLGVESMIMVINKMDLVDYAQKRFEEISAELNALAHSLHYKAPLIIPVSALKGDCVTELSPNMPWYAGMSLVTALETIPKKQDDLDLAFRMPIQWVNRPHLDFRGVSGTVAAGQIKVGDEISVVPSLQKAHISKIVTMDGELDTAISQQAVTLVFDREIDASRGDVVCVSSNPVETSDQFAAQVVWMVDEEALCHRNYLLKMGTITTNASLTTIKHSIDIESYQKRPATSLKLNDIARVDLKLDRPIPFESYQDNQSLGSFILIDRQNFNTVAAGMVKHPLRRASNIHYHPHSITQTSRETMNGHKGMVLWFTGLSGSGKSTLADHLERRLHAMGIKTYLLDGDNVRHGLNQDLGFTPSDRVENIRRVAEVAKLMVDAGLVVLTAFISPYQADRARARSLFKEGCFHEVFVDTPLELAEERDPKGLYKKARAGEIPNFTGIGSPYEAPDHPELHVKTADLTPSEAVEEMITYLEKRLK